MQWNMYCTCNVVHYSFFLFQATKTMKILFTSIVFILQIWIAQGRLINILNQMALKGESVKNAWSCHPSQNPKISEHLFQRFRMRANFNWRSSLQLQGIIKISLASHADRSNLDRVHFVLLSIYSWQNGKLVDVGPSTENYIFYLHIHPSAGTRYYRLLKCTIGFMFKD